MSMISRLVFPLCLVVFFSFHTVARGVALPSAVDIQVMPGEHQVLEIPLQNTSSENTEISFSVFHVAFDAENAPVLGKPATDVAWISVEETLSLAEAGARDTVSFTVAPPPDAISGAYVFALVASEVLEGSIVLNYGSAVLVFVTVGTPHVSGECIQFSRQQDGTFYLTLNNVDQGILYDEGHVVLRGLFDIPYGAILSNPSGHRIAPGQSRSWTSEALSPPWFAIGPLEYSLEGDYVTAACPRISAGFGWIPFVGIFAGALGILAICRQRKP